MSPPGRSVDILQVTAQPGTLVSAFRTPLQTAFSSAPLSFSCSPAPVPRARPVPLLELLLFPSRLIAAQLEHHLLNVFSKFVLVFGKVSLFTLLHLRCFLSVLRLC